MKIAFLGDIHGSWLALQRAIKKAVAAGAEKLIQVGDLGLMSWRMKHASTAILYEILESSPIPVLYIKGIMMIVPIGPSLTRLQRSIKICSIFLVVM